MGIPRKGNTPKRKSTGPVKSAPPKTLDSDFDDDDAESSGSDAGDMLVSGKRTPKQGMTTPGLTKSGKKKDVHVSFQLQQGKNTPGEKTPKGAKITPKGNQRPGMKGTPMPAKRTPGAMQAKSSGKKDSLKEFSGMNIFGGKIETLSPPLKGKIHPAAIKLGFFKGKKEDIKNEDEDSDDFEDDSDQESDDIDEDLADDLDEELDDDDLDEEDLDDEDVDEEDDNSLESEEEENAIRQQILAMKEKGSKQTKKEKVLMKAMNKSAEPAQKTPKTKGNDKPVQKTPKSKENSQPVQKTPKAIKNAEKDEPKSPQKKVEIDPEEMSLEQKRRCERDAKNLFVRNIPREVTIDELKALSPDILDVSLPKMRYQQKSLKKVKTYFAFLEFASEAKAEENYKVLQGKELRGAPLYVDFVGAKSKLKPISANDNVEYSRKILFVSGLTTDTTIAQVAQLFPKAYSINMNKAPEYRNAHVYYHSEDDASQAFKANANAKINGRTVSVLHGLDSRDQKKKSRKRKKSQTKSGQSAAKRNKLMTPKVETEEIDDDDDDDDDDEEDE